MFSYEEFIENVKNECAVLCEDGGKISINHIMKNNDTELDGLVITSKNSIIAPTIYLNNYYKEYCAGKDFDAIVENIKDVYLANRDQLDFDPSVLLDFNNVKDMICYKLVNYSRNEAFKDGTP